MEKLIGGTIIGALAGVFLSMILSVFGIHQAEWFVALGTVVGVFIGLLVLNEEEQADTHGHVESHASTEHGHAPAHAPAHGHADHHGAAIDPAEAARQQERHERQRAAVARVQDQVVAIVQDPSFKRAMASGVVGAFLILPFAVLLLISGIIGVTTILWWIAAGAVVGAFIGLLKAVEDEQPHLAEMAEAEHGGEAGH